MSERGVEAHISTELSCTVIVDGGSSRDGSTEARLQALSLEGAVVRTSPPLRDLPAGEVRLRLSELELPVQVLSSNGDGELRLSFGDLQGERRAVIEGLVQMVLDGGGGRGRQHPRVAMRAEVTCRSAEEIRAVMCDLSQGGLGLETEVDLDVGTELSVNVQLGGFPHPLSLTGRVVHVRSLPEGRYHAGLRFDDLAPERSDVLRDLIQFLVVPSPPSS